MSMLQILEVPAHVIVSLNIAATVTGVDADYLALTAARESNFENAAKASTSSALGMFQFIDQTWLRVVAEKGDRHGLKSLSRHIKIDQRGRHHVHSKHMRQRILSLRKDPTLAAIMAGHLTKRNGNGFRKLHGREASRGELYLAHFLGVRSAVKLAKLVRNAPGERADRHFRAAAKSNTSLFYKGRKPRTIRQVYGRLVSKHTGVRVSFSARPNPQVVEFTSIETVLASTLVSSHQPQRKKMRNPARPDLQYLAALMRLPTHGK